MGDSQIRINSANPDSEEARRSLSTEAVDSRTSPRDVRVERTGDSGDRSQFRSMCANELKGMRDDLHHASESMKSVNEAVEQGKLKPGSDEWKAAVQKAAGEYAGSVKRAEDALYERNTDGSLKIDPQTKEPVLSNLGKQVAAERTNLAQDMDLVNKARSEGRALTEQEMARLGVRSNNPNEVARDLKQADMMLADLQRQAGYAHANLGLALIRASAGLPEADKQAQIAAGQQELDNAAFLDKKMESDPNFVKHFKRVVKIATGQDIEYAGDQGTAPVGDGTQQVIRRGDLNLPSGTTDATAQGFKNPFDILAQTEANIKSPLSKENIDGFNAAIAAADSIDRNVLSQRMDAANQYIEAAKARGEDGKRVASTIAAMDQAEATMKQQHDVMATMIPGITQAGGQKAVDMLKALQGLDTPEKLGQFLNNPANKQAIQEFQGLPKGAEFLSQLQQFQSNNKVLADGERVLNQYDPKIMEARKEIVRDDALMNSSLDARAHFVTALVRDPANQTPENLAMAQKAMKEMAFIKPALLTTDQQFVAMAQGLGLGPDGKGGLDVIGKTTDATTNGTGAGAQLDQASMTSLGRAYQAYADVMNGKPLDAAGKQAFEQAIADASRITPEAVAAQRTAVQNELAATGWNQQLEQQYVGLNTAVGQAFGKMPQDKQTAVQQIQGQIDAITSTDNTAQQQRQKLEGDLQALGSDPSVKAFLDARVALAQFYQQNPDKVAARMKAEQAEETLQALEHGKAITEGLYGAALVQAKDASARDHLVKAAADPVALQLAPEIVQAIQRTGDQTIVTDGQKLAQQNAATTGDQTQRTSDATTGNGQPNPQQYDAAMTQIAAAQEALSKVQQNGQPLSPELNKVFTDAIAATSAIDPAGLQAMKAQLQQSLLQGWTQEQETKYTQVNTAMQQAEAKISAPSQQAINTFLGTLNPQDPNAKTAFEAKLKELSGSDPTVAAYVKARDEAQAFYAATPTAAKRDQYEIGTHQIAQLEHGKALTQTLYAAALASTGNADDLAKAKTQIAEAMKDQGLVQIFPQAAEVQRQLAGAGGDNTAITGASAEMDKIPGFPQLRQAETIMQDKSIPIQQRIERAAPLYEQAIEESKKINVGKLDTDLAAIGTRLQAIKDAAAKETDQTKLAAMQTEYNKLAGDADKLGALRLEPMQSRLFAAIASNSAAVELRAQAEKDPANKDALIRTADALDAKASGYLRGLEQQDPRMWRENPTIQGAAQQADKHQKIDPNAANAIGQVQNIQNNIVDFGVNGPFKVTQPLWMASNLAGEALLAPSKIPVVGPVVGFLPGAIGSGISREDEARPGAALALAYAKAKDPNATNAAVADIRHDMANQAVHIGADIGSAYLGIAAGNLAVNMLPKTVGTPLRLLTFGVAGLSTTAASNAAIDWSANKIIGTDQRDFAEIMSHSTAAFGMTWGLKGLGNMQANSAEAAAAGQRLSFGQNFTKSMQIWNPGLTAEQSALFKGITAEQNTALSSLNAAERATLTAGTTVEREALLSRLGITGEQASVWSLAQRPTTFTGMLSGNGGRLNFAQTGEYQFTGEYAANGSLQLGEQTAGRLSNLRPELHADFQQRLLGKMTPAEFNALSASQKAATVNGVLDDMAASTITGGKFSKLPFSGATRDARAAMAETPQAAKDLFSRHWTETRMGQWGYRFGSGAAAMGVYGAGEVNPLLVNHKTGEHFTFSDMGWHMGENALWGGVAGWATPYVGKALNYTVAQPLRFVMQKPAAFIFDAGAKEAGAWAGVGRMNIRGGTELARELTGAWRIAGADTGVTGLKAFGTGDVLKAAAIRAGAGGGVAGTFGFITHNPWTTNNTWAQAGEATLKYGGYGAAAGVAAPYALFAGRAGLEYIGKPLYNGTVYQVFGKAAEAEGSKAGIGVRAWNKVEPAIQSGRAAAGRFSDRWVVNPTKQAYAAAMDTNAGKFAKAAGASYVATSLAPTMLIEGQAAGAAYGNLEWWRINRQADAILKAAKEEEERKARAGQPANPGGR